MKIDRQRIIQLMIAAKNNGFGKLVKHLLSHLKKWENIGNNTFANWVG